MNFNYEDNDKNYINYINTEKKITTIFVLITKGIEGIFRKLQVIKFSNLKKLS